MNESSELQIGQVCWQDLTVENPEVLRDFYSRVVGWRPEPVDMGDYADFNMVAPQTGQPTAGICHARGPNKNLPAQWLIYITVEDLDHSAKRCLELGGQIIDGPRAMGQNRFCVIRDPAGAVAALIGE